MSIFSKCLSAKFQATLILGLLALPSSFARADEAELKKIIAVQQAAIVKMQAQIQETQTALNLLKNDKTIVRKNPDGKVVADSASYATTAGSATTADSATNAAFCQRLKSEGGANTIGLMWEGSTLYFNIDSSMRRKAL